MKRETIVRDERGVDSVLSPQVFDEMRLRGLVWERDGRWYTTVANLDFDDRLWLAVCDFCQGRPVVYEAECDTFDLPMDVDGRPRTMLGNWLACQVCGELVEAQDIEGLFLRVLEQKAAGFELPSVLLVEPILIVHELFWQHYKGIHRLEPKAL